MSSLKVEKEMEDEELTVHDPLDRRSNSEEGEKSGIAEEKDNQGSRSNETGGQEEEKNEKGEEKAAAALEAGALSGEQATRWKPTGQFWLIMIALCLSTFLSALDFTSVSTALPTIAKDLGGNNFVWVGSAYALTSTAWLPWSGGLSHVFGRRPIMLASLLFFGVGSTVCGAATSMNMLIIGRSIQGVGGGGILSMCEQIACDLVPLAYRGQYMGLLGAVWAVSAAIGPLIGGVFADSNWRWLFYMNLPILGVATPAVVIFLKLHTPAGTIREKLARVDFTVNMLFVASATSTILSLTWAGVKYPWDSYRILVPLILGLAGMVVYVILERYFVPEPTMPVKELGTKTSILGYVNTFLHGLTTLFVTYYLPVYYQGVKGHSATRSGVDLFPLSITTGPFAIAGGMGATILGEYKYLNFGSWVFFTLGMGLLAILDTTTSTGVAVVLLLVVSFGIAPLFPLTIYPVVAPLDPSLHARAMATHAFTRAFGQVWGITIGATIIQNQLNKRLPESFVALFPKGEEIAYASIPVIRTLEQPLKRQVQDAFADSMRIVWITGTAICAVGTVLVLLFKVYALHQQTDGEWGIEDKKSKKSKIEQKEEA